MNKPVDFLGIRSERALRREILNICNSYNNDWDILCEITQNSYDAIVRYVKKHGENGRCHSITLTINAQKKSIRIEDTGTGIEAAKIQDILGPNSTDKDTDFDLIGEKGVGLTYAIFSCNRFILRTQTATSYFEGQVDNASLWKNAKISEKPQLICLQEKELQDETNTFTDITLEDVESHDTEGDTIFDHPVGIIEWILRTKTVIGYLKTIFHENATPFDATLIYIGKDGQKHSHEIPASYMLPIDFIHKQDYIDLDEFKERAAVYDDRQKKMKLQGKALYKVGSVPKGNRTINYYCFYAPSRNFWKEICERTNLFSIDSSGEKNNLYQGGIYIATKGIPSGALL